MTPHEVYGEAIARGDLKPDAAQEHAIGVLEELYVQVVNPSPKGRGWRAYASRVRGYIIRDHVPHPNPLPMRRRGHSPGVYLYGPVGRGKSAMMDLFFGCLPDDILKRRVHFHEFMLEVHAYLHDLRVAGQGAVDDALPKFAAHVVDAARVLCFDEFHVKDVADAMILSRLFTALWDAGVVTVATSNWAPDDLYAGGLQRDLFLPFISLLKNRLQVVNVAGPHDYRATRVAGKPVYFSPLGAGADAAMDQMFRDLTDTDVTMAEPDVLNVLGHTVQIPRVSHGVARGTFAEFCERPLAAQDYLAVARAYHTVMIDHVPRLTYDRRNETKRFMILVDVLYESKRRLVISADAPLDRLFIDNEHAFEFQRTASRLQEMGSAGYLTLF
jgi:cell division protein ZapE